MSCHNLVWYKDEMRYFKKDEVPLPFAINRKTGKLFVAGVGRTHANLGNFTKVLIW